MLRAYRAELRHRLNQWKHRISRQDAKSLVLKKTVIENLRLRLKRQAFDMFSKQVKNVINEEHVNRRLKEVRHRFATRILRRCFLGIVRNGVGLIEARKSIKKVLERRQHEDLKFCLSLWQRNKDDQKKTKRAKKKMVLH